MSGIMDVTGEPEGEPQKIGVAYADILTGLYAANAIQAGLLMRERTGRGQLIDMALFDVMVGTLANQAMNTLVSGEDSERIGNAHPNIVPYQAFACSDGWAIVAVGNDAQFARFAGLIGLEDDPTWSTNEGRVADRERLTNAVAALMVDWTRDNLLEALETECIPGGPINSVMQALSDPQIDSRGMVIEVVASDGTCIPGVRTPIVFSDAELSFMTASPRLGDAD
jgi:crotonobetainyl-CoA:carnitine CoA-transferase CaiB-like acyl-CoA transferase